LFPVFYAINRVDNALIEYLVKMYFRQVVYKNDVNNLGKHFHTYMTRDCIKIGNQVLQAPTTFDYMSAIRKLVIDHMDPQLKTRDAYVRNMVDLPVAKVTYSRYLLFFYETCITSDNHVVSLDNTVEHIFPQKDIEKLKDSSSMNKLGNLTLLEKGNSQNGHKGNSSIKATEYHLRLDSYKQSCVILTRRIPTEYPTQFTEAEILDRTRRMATELEKLTSLTN
jgi:hypothetical protein